PDVHRGRMIPVLDRALARSPGGAEDLFNEVGRILRQLPLQLDERCRRRKGNLHDQGAKPGDRVRHALRRMARQTPEGGVGRTEGCLRKSKSKALAATTRPGSPVQYCG